VKVRVHLFQEIEYSAPQHQGIDNLIVLEVIAQTQQRNIAAALHRQRLWLIRSNRLALHEQKLTLLTLGAGYHHRGAIF
jgi:hypothetical protein